MEDKFPTFEFRGKLWLCYDPLRNDKKNIIPCRIFKDFNDMNHRCPFAGLCERIDRGNYEDFCFIE